MVDDLAELPEVHLRGVTLRGQGALVTNSASGLGRAIALCLARAGGRIAIHAQPGADCRSVIDEITAFGGTAVAVAGSVDTSEGCQAIWQETMTRLGAVDTLVNAGDAGGEQDPNATTDSDESVWEALVLGPIRLARVAAASGLRSPGGSIVNVATPPRTTSDPRLSAYRNSQAALVSATRALAVTLAPAGIRVNVIATWIGDVNIARVMFGPLLAEIDTPIAPGAPADQDDVTGTALYLASDASAPTSGSVFLAEARVG